MTPLIDFDALDRVVPAHDPFDHFVADALLTPPSIDALAASFPPLPVSGLLPAGTLRLSPLLTQLADELRGPRMAAIMSAKFGVALDGRATMLTVRSRCAAKDGRIHTDSTGKVATLLLYLNPVWDQEGGRLRVLRSGTDLDDYAAEVPPLGGTMVAFRRSDHSWPRCRHR